MSETPSSPIVPPRQPLILLVDDNPQNLELLEAYMEDLTEARVATATNGLEALAKVAQEKPDVILLDIMMPKMSGFEVCKRLKSDPQTRDIVIIMVTALNETGDVERAAECGTDDYISKPIDKEALTAQVRNLLAARRSAGGGASAKAADPPQDKPKSDDEQASDG
jgi:two-component system alkaline phosphatase synthesis response regulator PhoP